MSSRIYLDHHSATRPYPLAVEKMLPFYREHWGSSTAPHQMGQALLLPHAQAMEKICCELGAGSKDSFFFCGSGSEAINSVFFSHYLHIVRETGKNHIVTINTAEQSTALSLQRLEQFGCSEKTLSVNSRGQITKEMLAEVLRPRTSLVSLPWANGLTGVVHPIADLAEVCQEKGVSLHVDASHVLGKIFFRYEDLPIDFLTFEGFLVHAPQGTGGVLVKSGRPFHPLIIGKHADNVGMLTALSLALEENARHFDHLNLETARLRDQLERGILTGFPEAVVFYQDVERLPNCTAIAFPGVASEALLYLLNRHGVYATCGGGHSQTLSHVLMASGIDGELAQCAVSFSLSFETTESEIADATRIIIACANQLRVCSLQIMEKNR